MKKMWIEIDEKLINLINCTKIHKIDSEQRYLIKFTFYAKKKLFTYIKFKEKTNRDYEFERLKKKVFEVIIK